MAISLQGVLFKTIIDPTGAEQGATRVNAAQAGMRKAFSNYAKQRMQDEAAIVKSLAAIEKQQAAYDAAVASSASPAKIALLKSKIDDLKSAHESLRAEAGQRNALGADVVKSWQKNVDEATKSSKNFSSSFASIKTMASGLAPVLAGAFSIAGVVKFLNELDQLGRRAEDLKITAATLKSLEVEATQAGLSSGEFDTTMKSLAINLSKAASGEKVQADALASLGVSLVDANGHLKTNRDVLFEVADAFANNAGQAKLTKIAVDLFGESGIKMQRVLVKGSQALAENEKAFISYNRAAKDAADLNNRVKTLSDDFELGLSKAFGTVSILAQALGDLSSGKSWNASELVRQQKQLNEDAANQMARLNDEKQAAAEVDKKQAEEQAAADKTAYDRQLSIRAAAQGELTTGERILRAKADLVAQYYEMEKLDKTSKEYSAAEEENFKKKLELTTLEAKFRSESDKKAASEQDKIKSTQNEINQTLFNNLSLSDKINKATSQLLDYKEALKGLDKNSVEYAQTYANAIKKRVELEGLKKQAGEAAKQEAEKAKTLAQSRADYDYELKLQILKAKGKPDDAKKLEIQKEYTRLLTMGFTAEQAAARLKAKANAEASKTVKYSDKDVKRAQDIIKRGAGGTVGKKTLEQAQAIVSGQEIKGTAVGVFSDAKKNAKIEKGDALTNKAIAELSTAKTPTTAAMGVQQTAQVPPQSTATQGATTQQPTPTTQGATTQETKTSDASADALSQILDQLKTLTSSFQEAFA